MSAATSTPALMKDRNRRVLCGLEDGMCHLCRISPRARGWLGDISGFKVRITSLLGTYAPKLVAMMQCPFLCTLNRKLVLLICWRRMRPDGGDYSGLGMLPRDVIRLICSYVPAQFKNDKRPVKVTGPPKLWKQCDYIYRE